MKSVTDPSLASTGTKHCMVGWSGAEVKPRGFLNEREEGENGFWETTVSTSSKVPAWCLCPTLVGKEVRKASGRKVIEEAELRMAS